jgi:arsenite transporter
MQVRASSTPALERVQVPLCFGAVAAGAALGTAAPGVGSTLEGALYPALAFLLYTMFLHIPLADVGRALSERRFLAATLVTNFAVLPPVVFALTRLLPYDRTLLVAALLVLLVPCTDWSITFAGLGGGSARRMVAATPLLLAVQFATLPLFLWLFAGRDLAGVVEAGPFVEAFVAVIAGPLAAAALTERLASRSRPVGAAAGALGSLPVAMTAVVLFFVVASQIEVARNAGADLLAVLPVFALFPLAALGAAWLVARAFGLGVVEARTLSFSAATRNSFVVLPLALALPEGAELAAAVIVTQALVELTAMVAFIRLVPRWVLPQRVPH